MAKRYHGVLRLWQSDFRFGPSDWRTNTIVEFYFISFCLFFSFLKKEMSHDVAPTGEGPKIILFAFVIQYARSDDHCFQRYSNDNVVNRQNPVAMAISLTEFILEDGNSSHTEFRIFFRLNRRKTVLNSYYTRKSQRNFFACPGLQTSFPSTNMNLAFEITKN